MGKIKLTGELSFLRLKNVRRDFINFFLTGKVQGYLQDGK